MVYRKAQCKILGIPNVNPCSNCDMTKLTKFNGCSTNYHGISFSSLNEKLSSILNLNILWFPLVFILYFSDHTLIVSFNVYPYILGKRAKQSRPE